MDLHPWRSVVVLLFAVLGASAVSGQEREDVLPPGDAAPVLRVDAAGPLSYVSSLAFSPDGEILYAAGWDKVVHVWVRRGDRLEYAREAVLRVPVGAGLDGGLNAIAVSPDGEWLAAAGRSLARNIAGHRESGWILPGAAMLPSMRLDWGTIYLFHTRTREVRLLRGHAGPVLSLAFAPASREGGPILISTADEWDEKRQSHAGVIRAWDAVAAREIAKLTQVPDGNRGWQPLPASQGWRPGLAPWRAGAAPSAVRVAFTWGDDWLRIWDVGANLVSAAKGAQYTSAVAVLDGGTAVLTGAHAEIGQWRVPVGGNGRIQVLSRDRDFQRWTELPQRHLPSALALLPGRGRARDAAFVVAEYSDPAAGGGADVRYRLVITSADGSGRIMREQPLWSGAPRIPAIASSPDGRLLAVAGNEDNEILVYATADLIAGRAQPQVLRGRGEIFRSVAFARKGDSLGLAFRPEPPRSPGDAPRELGASDLIFDIANRRIAAERAGWRTVSPAPGDWRAELQGGPEGPAQIVARRGQQNIGNVRLEPESDRDPAPQVTAFALCPPTEHCKRPLLAVATHVRGEPKLSIYLADTGEEVRRLTGHTERIPSLAFSDDGSLLASAGEDRTVRVWSMVDLEKKTIGRHGIVRGLQLRTDDQGRLVVRGSETPELRPDDVITGVRAGAEELPLRTPWDFYGYVLNFAPGETVTVQVRRGNQSQAVQLPLVQASDERKPLFSLFVAPGDRPRQFAWIGWHPRGPYDASGPDAERSLGWHFNTGERDAPAKFAAAGEYRHLYYTRDLLRELVERHEVPPPAPLPDAKMSLILRQREGQVLERDEYNDLVRVADNELEAVIGLLNDFPAQSIAGVEWQFDDGEFHPAERSTERGWTADLSKLNWTRGFHTLRARLRTRELHPREFVTDEFLLFQPPPPAISASDLPEQVREARVAVSAEVAQLEQPVSVSLLHRYRGETIEETAWTLEKPEKFEHALELRPGENQIVWIATNRDASEEYKERETARITRVVRFAEPALPTLALQSVEAQPRGGEASAIKSRDAVYITEHPTVRLKGEISAQAPLQKAAIQVAGDARALDNFEPNAAEFAIDELLTLKPGRQTVVIHAETADGKSETRAELEYRPDVPRIRSTTLSARSVKPLPKGTTATNEMLYAGYHEPAVQVVAELGPVEGPEFESHVILNGRELEDVKPEVDRQAGRLTATVPLQPGPNEIQVRLSNAWKRTRSGDAVLVHFKRPPRLKEIEAPEQSEQSFVDLMAVAESADDLPLRDVDLEVNGQMIADDLIKFEPANDERTAWTISASDIPLDEGRNQIKLLAWNRDGSALEPLVHAIQVMAPPPPKPEVTILSPTNDQSISQRRVTVELAIQSDKSPVQRADLWVNGRAVPLPNIEKKAGFLRFSHSVELENGKNEIRATATNAGGQSTAAICRVSCTPEPVLIEIARLGDVVPRKDAAGQVRFAAAVRTSSALLQGRVIIAEPEQFRESPRLVKVWVNGFQQGAVELKAAAPGAREFTFETEIVFNRTQRNRIEVMLPDLPRDQRAANIVYVDCAKPNEEQELHLLIVGVNAPDAEKLKQQAYEALQAEFNPGLDYPASNAFERIIDYGPLVGDVKTADVYRELGRLHALFQSRRLAGVDRINQVVMIYYQGKAVPDSRRESLILATSDNWDDPARDHSAITNEYLEGILGDVFGAHLIALDVQREGPADNVSAFLQSRSSPLGFIVVSAGSEEVVKGAPFLTAAQGAIANSAELGDFLQQLQDQFAAGSPSREIEYEHYVHESLHSLNIGAKSGAGG